MRDLDEMLATGKSAAAQVKLAASGNSKSATNLKTNVDALARKRARAQKQAGNAKEQQVMDQVKKTAKEAAAKVKEMEAEAPPIYTVDVQKLIGDGIFTDITRHTKLENEALNLDRPFLVKEISLVADWGKDTKVQVALGNFGGKYKKKSSYLSDGQVQMALYAREGKEESQELFARFLEQMPKGQVVESRDTPAASTCDNAGLYGYDPRLRTAGSTPNALHMLKILASGEVKWIFPQLTSLLCALRIMTKKDQFTLGEIREQLRGMTEEKLRKLKADGSIMVAAFEHPWETVYAQAGWYAVEESVKGVLVYGCRCTLVVKSQANHDQY